jgi:hypothetical protein
MGTNTLPTAVDGTVIPSTDHNSIKTALTNDHVPRNTSGVPTAGAGSLGTLALPWLKLIFGDVASKLRIESDGDDLILISKDKELVRFNKDLLLFKNDGNTVASIGPNGILASSFPDTGVLSQMKTATFAANGTFIAPNDVTGVIVEALGGGGGGASGNHFVSRGAPGGGGGAGAIPIIQYLPVTPGGSYGVTVGTGGTGGVQILNGGSNGNPGTVSQISSIMAYGGAGGIAGVNSAPGNTGGVGGEGVFNAERLTSAGGGGGANNGVNGGVGANSMRASGGALGPGSGINVQYGSGGGGGGAGLNGGGAGGAGGVGGNGGNGSTPAGFGGGGGGGGGGGTTFFGGNGGNGAPGLIRVMYVSHL